MQRIDTVLYDNKLSRYPNGTAFYALMYRRSTCYFSTRRSEVFEAPGVIRPACASDVPTLRQIVASTLQEFCFKEDPDGIDQDLQDPIKTYGQPKGLLDVLTQSDQVVGFVGLIPLDGRTIELRKIYLAQNVRGCGFGGKLLDHAIKWAQQQNFQWMTLQTSSRLQTAGSLYRSRGFAMVEGLSRGKDCDQLMRLDL